MTENAIDLVGATALADGIVVFFAGPDPLTREFRSLIDWLTQRGVKVTAIDAGNDAALAALLENESSRQSFPILFANDRLIGGGLLRSLMADSEQLLQLLARPLSRKPPDIVTSPAAIAKLREALKSTYGVIRLTVSADFQHEISVDEARSSDIETSTDDVTLVLDQLTAARVDGLEIDWIDGPQPGGFRIDNPNAALGLRRIDCDTLAEWMFGTAPPLLIDVRDEREYLEERIAGARLFDDGLLGAISLLDRTTRLVFYCKNGLRSMRVARLYLELGFVDVSTLRGGMDAWKGQFGQQNSHASRA